MKTAPLQIYIFSYIYIYIYTSDTRTSIHTHTYTHIYIYKTHTHIVTKGHHPSRTQQRTSQYGSALLEFEMYNHFSFGEMAIPFGCFNLDDTAILLGVAGRTPILAVYKAEETKSILNDCVNCVIFTRFALIFTKFIISKNSKLFCACINTHASKQGCP